MSNRINTGRRRRVLAGGARCLIGCLACVGVVAHAGQTVIPGPADSGRFGTQVKTLPNGNFVVTDPYGPSSNFGTVYLYSANGEMISSLSGSHAGDYVGF